MLNAHHAELKVFIIQEYIIQVNQFKTRWRQQLTRLSMNSVRDNEEECRGGGLMRNNGLHCHVLGARHWGGRQQGRQGEEISEISRDLIGRSRRARPPNMSDFIKNVGRDSPE